LPLVDRLREIRGVQQRRLHAGVEPGETAALSSSAASVAVTPFPEDCHRGGVLKSIALSGQ
jgi:hypothetical protein